MKIFGWSSYGFLVLLCSLGSWQCAPIELYEKSVAMPGQQWDSRYRPSFEFVIKDTTARYYLSVVFRHRDLYHFNNIWLRVTVRDPQGKTRHFDTDQLLGTNENGWLGSGMDDIYEHRLSLQKELVSQAISLRLPGTYRFTLEQLMREDPLQAVMNVGLRVQKKP